MSWGSMSDGVHIVVSVPNRTALNLNIGFCVVVAGGLMPALGARRFAGWISKPNHYRKCRYFEAE